MQCCYKNYCFVTFYTCVRFSRYELRSIIPVSVPFQLHWVLTLCSPKWLYPLYSHQQILALKKKKSFWCFTTSPIFSIVRLSNCCQIVSGHLSHWGFFDFCCKWDGKPLEDFEWKDEMIWLSWIILATGLRSDYKEVKGWNLSADWLGGCCNNLFKIWWRIKLRYWQWNSENRKRI